TYNDWRGEPRSRHAKKAAAAGQPVGDCVDCNACVAVCPMGIDIRDGQQLECITCALCIDACDGVMSKLGRERSLISYATLSDYNANMAVATGGGAHPIDPRAVRGPDGQPAPGLRHFHLSKIFRPRAFVYLGTWSLIGLVMLYALATRDRLQVNVLHDRNPQYVTLSDGSIRNGYTVKLLNMVPEPRTFAIALDGLDGASMSGLGATDAQDGTLLVAVEPDVLKSLKLFVRLPPDALPGETVPFHFVVRDVDGQESVSTAANFMVPETSK
ncbi:MAG: cytochrome c oxidase accessory protein CcoG, partial [Rhizobiaceae bacterium]|nr:cytochrome c oxidase accessory protein CcoG [Rhizobiaceae bacterium]